MQQDAAAEATAVALGLAAAPTAAEPVAGAKAAAAQHASPAEGPAYQLLRGKSRPVSRAFKLFVDLLSCARSTSQEDPASEARRMRDTHRTRAREFWKGMHAGARG